MSGTVLPRVLVVSCGGTISSVAATPGAHATPALSAAELIAALPSLAGTAELETRTFSVAPSAHTTLADVVELHAELRVFAAGLGAQPGGIVVSQGTDTLEEVAFALQVLWDSQVPVVVTGAMRNMSLPGPDGPANLLAAITAAAAPAARGAGVLVAFNDQLHSARFVRKSHTTNVAAFGSPTVGPVGYVTEGVARLALAVAQPPGALSLPDAPDTDVPVALLTAALGDDGRLLGHLLPAGYRGLVIAGLGGGHLPPGVASSPVLDELCEAIPVVLSSRTGAGEVLSRTYAFPGSETDLLARGLISSGELEGPKARVLLSLLLAANADRAAISAAFAAYTA